MQYEVPTYSRRRTALCWTSLVAIGALGLTIAVSCVTLPVSADASVSVMVPAPDGSVPQVSQSATANIAGVVVSAAGRPISGAKLAVEDQNGTVTVLTSAMDGTFQASVDTPSGAIIGVAPVADAWISEDVPFAGDTSGIRLNADRLPGLTEIDGELIYQGSAYPVTEVSLRETITHTHYYAKVDSSGHFRIRVPIGSYEVYALLTNQTAVYLLQPFLTTSSSLTLSVPVPALGETSTISTPTVTVNAGDSGVTPSDLVSVKNAFLHIYPMDIRDVGVTPTHPLTIHVYSTESAYKQFFQQMGYSSTDAEAFATQSAAVTFGTDTIVLLMPRVLEADIENTLAHEFTHVLINYVSFQIPSWANEGIAWHQGIAGELDASPDALLKTGLDWTAWLDIVSHAADGTLEPLGQGNDLTAQYNMETQDYYAVERDLLPQAGVATFWKYVKLLDKSPATAFQSTFGETFTQFAARVTNDLADQVKQSDAGFRVQVRANAGGPTSIYVINPAGVEQIVGGLTPGRLYTITCHSDGSVTVPPGLVTAPTASLPRAVKDAWVLGLNESTLAIPRQEFILQNSFGQPYVESILLYDAAGHVIHAYPAVGVPGGLQITNLEPYYGG